MKVLELFAGSKSIGNVAEQLRMNVYSSDIEQFGGIDYVVDIRKNSKTFLKYFNDWILDINDNVVPSHLYNST